MGTVFAINYGTQFSKKNSSIQNGSISIGRSYSKIAFLGLRKGTLHTFEPQCCAQKWRSHNLGEEPGKPKPSISARTPLCKSCGFCSHKGQVPFRNFHSPCRSWKKRNFHGELGDKGRLTWNILHLILFSPTKRDVSQPILKQRPKRHHKTSDPKIFISHIPLLNFAGAALHITQCMCANPEPTFQRYTTKPQTLRFSSHTSVLNFAGTALRVAPHM